MRQFPRSTLRLTFLLFLVFSSAPAAQPLWGEEAPALAHEEGAAARVPPFFWYESDPAQQRKFLMALLLYWSGRDHSGRFNLLAPLYYYSEVPGEKLRVLLPIHFHYESDGSRFNLWGPYAHKVSLRSETRLLFPLFYKTKSPESQSTILPLYYSSRDNKTSARVVFPLFWSLRSLAKEKKSYETFIPFYFRMWDDRSSSFLSPLVWKFRSPGLSWGVVPPYFWRRTEERGWAVGFPLYWRFAKKEGDKQKEVMIAVPYFHLRSGLSSFRSFVPLYWGRTKLYEEEGSTTAFKTGGWNLFLPLLYQAKRPDGAEKLVTPLFSRIRDADGTTYGHSGPGFFLHDPWGGKTEGFFPLLAYREEPDFYRFRFLTLFLERHKDGKHSETTIFPLFRYRRDSDRRQFAFPGFYRDRDPLRSRGLLLSYYWESERMSEEPDAPLRSRRRIFFPLAWHSQNEERSRTIILPNMAFYRRDSLRLALVAPFYFSRTRDADRLIVVPPLVRRKSPDREWLGFLFFFMQKRGDLSRSLALLPLYRHSYFPGGRSIFLLGLYRLKAEDGTQGVALPYIWDHRGRTQYEFFPPVYWYFKRPTWQARSLLTFYSFRNNQIKEKGFFPLVASTLPAEESSGTAKHFLADSHRVLPFYFYRRLDNGSDLWLPFLAGRIEKENMHTPQERIRGRLFLAQYWEKSRNHFINRFDPIYSYRRTPHAKGFSVPTAPLPLWQHEVDGIGSEEGEVVRGAVFPYYWKESRRLRRDIVVPLFYRRRAREADGKTVTSGTTWLLAYYAKFDRETSTQKRFFIPLYWSFRSPGEERTVMPPLWLEKGPNYGREIFFPLWWHARRDKENTYVFFPLFFRSKDETEGTASVIAPGFWYARDREGSRLLLGPYFQKSRPAKGERACLFFPLFWSERSPQKSALTLFPLYWHWAAGERSVSYFFPLYFRHEREDLKWNVAFPLYWSFKTAERHVQIVPPFFSIKTPSTGARTTGFAPLWTYTTEPAEDRKVLQILGGLFGIETRGDQSKVRLLWVIGN